MANVDEVVIRIDVKAPDNDGEDYIATCEEYPYCNAQHHIKETAIAYVLRSVARQYSDRGEVLDEEHWRKHTEKLNNQE